MAVEDEVGCGRMAVEYSPTSSYPHPTLYSAAILPHPTSSFTAFFCHRTRPTLSYPSLPYLMLPSLTHPTPHPTLAHLPTQSYSVVYCHPTSQPTLSYSILPHITTSYLVLPCPTLSYSILPHPTPSNHI